MRCSNNAESESARNVTHTTRLNERNAIPTAQPVLDPAPADLRCRGWIEIRRADRHVELPARTKRVFLMLSHASHRSP
eukprot:972958-Prorocentrum_minimum.AAC.1